MREGLDLQVGEDVSWKEDANTSIHCLNTNPSFEEIVSKFWSGYPGEIFVIEIDIVFAPKIL